MLCALSEDANYNHPHNRPPDEKFREHFRHVCWRPAMHLGEENYALLAAFFEGMAMGYQDWHGGFMHSFLHEEFQQFLAKKYRRGGATLNNVIWSRIIPIALERDGTAVTERQKIDQLLADFEDFNNILVRMSVESVPD